MDQEKNKKKSLGMRRLQQAPPLPRGLREKPPKTIKKTEIPRQLVHFFSKDVMDDLGVGSLQEQGVAEDAVDAMQEAVDDATAGPPGERGAKEWGQYGFFILDLGIPFL